MIPRLLHGFFVPVCVIAAVVCGGARARAEPAALPGPDADGFVTLFNGHDLAGWEGLPDYWSVRDGAISGHQAKESSQQTFLVRSGLTLRDFELHFKYRFMSPEGNSGLQFRSTVIDQHTYRVGGYQADFDAQRVYDGSLYDEAGIAGNRGTLSNRAERTTWKAGNERIVEGLGPSQTDLAAQVNRDDWNDVILVARGNHITYTINGHLMTEMIDGSAAALQAGCLALQLHQGYTMDVRFKDIRVKPLN
jgi:hypothetical protein